MKEKEILLKIIAENGNCSWSKNAICKNCPIGKLKVRSDGTFMSCIEAVGIDGLPEEQADSRYKEIAIRLLISYEVDSLLKN